MLLINQEYNKEKMITTTKELNAIPIIVCNDCLCPLFLLVNFNKGYSNRLTI